MYNFRLYLSTLPLWYLWFPFILTMFIPAIVLSAVLMLPYKVAAIGPVIDVGYSTYQGIQGNGINSWLGVRYAEPPLKDLRWRAPRDPKPTDILQNADKVCLAM